MLWLLGGTMIVGVTHGEDGSLNSAVKYRGKISTGYEPMEGPNKKNAPAACGHFRMMKEVVKNIRVGTSKEIVSTKDWIVNEEVQKNLEKANGNNSQPKRIEIYSLYKKPSEMWESSMTFFKAGSGLQCKSHGKGTEAKYLQLDANNKRTWISRFESEGGCKLKECPDYIAGTCKQTGLLNCFPTIDLHPNPYFLTTHSINTIIGVESQLETFEKMLKVAHMVKQMEAGKELVYDGFFGIKMFLSHRKKKSGGRDVFITDLIPSPEFVESVMEPLKRGLISMSRKSNVIGGSESISLLGEASEKMLEDSKATMIESKIDKIEDDYTSDAQFEELDSEVVLVESEAAASDEIVDVDAQKRKEAIELLTK